MMIVIDEKEILVHKIILAAHSTVFSAMFKAGLSESKNKRIIVIDIEVDIMQKVVEFMYTETINSLPEYGDLLSILKVADKKPELLSNFSAHITADCKENESRDENELDIPSQK
ncbi:hypothetical protein PV326_001330 [Microctonus aethiopoides]|nr:hypothetical protein PV326_001330 [Microctonus aethiopoides]